VFPAPLSLLLWRSVYHTPDGRLIADGIHLPYFTEAKTKQGSSTRRNTLEDFRQEDRNDPQLIAGFERFHWFADGYTAMHPEHPHIIGDMRYCIEPDTFDSLWGFDMGASETSLLPRRSAHMVSFGLSRGERLHRAWDAMLGRDPMFKT